MAGEFTVDELVSKLNITLSSMESIQAASTMLMSKVSNDIVVTNNRLDAHDVVMSQKSSVIHTHTPNDVGLGSMPKYFSESPSVNSNEYLATSKAVYSVNVKATSNATEIAKKADKATVDAALSTKSNIEWVNSELSLKANQTITNSLIGTKADTTYVNTKLNLKADLVEGKVPTYQLPSFIDTVASYASSSVFPVNGAASIVYHATDTGKTYRWSGSAYVVIGSDLALGETSSTAYRGDRGKVAYDHSQAAHITVEDPAFIGSIFLDGKHMTDSGTTGLSSLAGCRSTPQGLVATGDCFPGEIHQDIVNGKVSVRISDVSEVAGDIMRPMIELLGIEKDGTVTGKVIATSTQALDVNNNTSLMTPLRTSQVIEACIPAAVANKADLIDGKMLDTQLPVIVTDAITKLNKMVVISTRTMVGIWTINNVVIGKMMLLTHDCKDNVDFAFIVTSGSLVGADTGSDLESYYGMTRGPQGNVWSSPSCIIIPNSTTVTIRIPYGISTALAWQ